MSIPIAIAKEPKVRRGDVISCERNNHEIMTAKRTMKRGDILYAENFEQKAIHFENGDIVTGQCPLCGSTFFDVKGRLHIRGKGFIPR